MSSQEKDQSELQTGAIVVLSLSSDVILFVRADDRSISAK